MYKVYLDNCTYNRPFDEQTQDLIRIETEAKLIIQSRIKDGKYSLVWSFMLDDENDANPDYDRRAAIEPWSKIAAEYCGSDEELWESGKRFLKMGIRYKDAIHLACAIKCGCDYFITTDKKLINKKVDGLKIVNPAAFLLETEEFL